MKASWDDLAGDDDVAVASQLERPRDSPKDNVHRSSQACGIDTALAQQQFG